MYGKKRQSIREIINKHGKGSPQHKRAKVRDEIRRIHNQKTETVAVHGYVKSNGIKVKGHVRNLGLSGLSHSPYHTRKRGRS